LLQVIGDAAAQAELSQVVEDYIVFHIASFAEAIDVNRFHAEHSQEIARILRTNRCENKSGSKKPFVLTTKSLARHRRNRNSE